MIIIVVVVTTIDLSFLLSTTLWMKIYKAMALPLIFIVVKYDLYFEERKSVRLKSVRKQIP
jgi:hypothetical protein